MPCPALTRTRCTSHRQAPVRSPSPARGRPPRSPSGTSTSTPATTSVFRRQRRGLVTVSATLVVPPIATTLLATTIAPVTRPAAPTHLRGRRTGDAVALAWNAVPGAQTFKVYVASSGARPFTVAGTRSTPAFTVGNLDVNTRYYFRISASNAGGWSPMSATLVMPAVVRPAAPPNLRGRRTGDIVALAWDAVPGAQTFKVYVASSGARPFTVAGTRNLDPRYYFRISASNAAGWSPVSTTLVMPAHPPRPPTCAPGAGRTTSRWHGTPSRARTRTSSPWRRRPPARTRS